MLQTSSSTYNLSIFREGIELASNSEQITLELLDKLDNPTNYTLLGYKGVLTIIMAKHYYSPFKKMEAFDTGKALLERAILSEPNNIELRYLRFTIQCNTPSFLKYNTSIQPDKTFLLSRIETCGDKDLKKRIILFLLQSEQISQQEKQPLKKLLP